MRVVAAADAHWPVIRALLPAPCARPATVNHGFLALDSAVRGATVVRHHSADAWIDVLVVSPFRRRGIGSLLLKAALGAAVAGGADRAVAEVDEIREPASGAFLRRHGFTRAAGLHTFEADFAVAAPVLLRTRGLLRESGRVPPDVRVVTLPEAPEKEVTRLYAEYIAERHDLIEVPLRLTDDPARWANSAVLLAGGVVAGVMLFEVGGGTAHIAARIVPREHQKRYANALLLAALADYGARNGIHTLRFESRESNFDTLKLARRLAAREVSRRTQFFRRVDACLPG